MCGWGQGAWGQVAPVVLFTAGPAEVTVVAGVVGEVEQETRLGVVVGCLVLEFTDDRATGEGRIQAVESRSFRGAPQGCMPTTFSGGQ